MRPCVFLTERVIPHKLFTPLLTGMVVTGVVLSLILVVLLYKYMQVRQEVNHRLGYFYSNDETVSSEWSHSHKCLINLINLWPSIPHICFWMCLSILRFQCSIKCISHRWHAVCVTEKQIAVTVSWKRPPSRLLMTHISIMMVKDRTILAVFRNDFQQIRVAAHLLNQYECVLINLKWINQPFSMHTCYS